ncbi:MAG: biotin/lipoyl-containing protein, partial [Desulfuromonadales bacterium]|nr:biotin/lipoyl-containing protein [Desulfuromonadales bacterium]
MDIKIPEVGESILEAMIANWLKEDGATVAKDEIICELETDKVNVELTAEASGILHIVVEQGQTVPIGTLIATIEEGDAEQKKGDAEQKGGDVEQFPKPKKTEPKAEDNAAAVAADKAEKKQASPPPANPAARLLAEKHGINLEDIAGSGRAGRVILEDVLAHEKSS